MPPLVHAGVQLRWQAPLVLGTVVLSTHALVQTWPVLAALYSAVPRWFSLGLAGALLLPLGARYERRLHDVRAGGREGRRDALRVGPAGWCARRSCRRGAVPSLGVAPRRIAPFRCAAAADGGGCVALPGAPASR